MKRYLKQIQSSAVHPLQIIRDPALIGLGLNMTYHRYRSGKAFNDAGTDIFEEEDWDNLILLDACRYDTYLEIVDDEADFRISRGSASKQFVRGNFTNKTLHDVVYISGNQWYLKLQEELDCELHAYYDVERDAADGFVPSPAAVTNAVLDLKDKYPQKRLLIHYMQPHAPYLGADNDPFEYERDGGIRETVRANSVDKQIIPVAYRKNLQYVMEHVERLIPKLNGKTVISSDHGEMLGDRLSPIPVSWYGHPPGIYSEGLVQVPWHVVANGPRKSIIAEAPDQSSADVDMSEVNEQLKNLGYKI